MKCNETIAIWMKIIQSLCSEMSKRGKFNKECEYAHIFKRIVSCCMPFFHPFFFIKFRFFILIFVLNSFWLISMEKYYKNVWFCQLTWKFSNSMLYHFNSSLNGGARPLLCSFYFNQHKPTRDINFSLKIDWWL